MIPCFHQNTDPYYTSGSGMSFRVPSSSLNTPSTLWRPVPQASSTVMSENSISASRSLCQVRLHLEGLLNARQKISDPVTKEQQQYLEHVAVATQAVADAILRLSITKRTERVAGKVNPILEREIETLTAQEKSTLEQAKSARKIADAVARVIRSQHSSYFIGWGVLSSLQLKDVLNEQERADLARPAPLVAFDPTQDRSCRGRINHCLAVTRIICLFFYRR